MKFIVLLFSLTTFHFLLFAQSQNNIEFNTPTVMIAGVKYSFSIPDNEDSTIYRLVGNDVVAKGINENLVLTPKHPHIDSILKISLLRITNGDTSIVRSQKFEVVSMPSPELNLGKYQSGEKIQIHKDSSEKISHVELIDLVATKNKVVWYNINGEVEISGVKQMFRFTGKELNEEILKQISKLEKPTKVTVNVVFQGSDQTMRAVKSEFIVECMTDSKWKDLKYPYHKLYSNKNVEVIQESSFYHQETLIIDYSKKQYIHCLSDPNGSNLTYEFQSLDSLNKFSVNKRHGAKEKLVRMKNKKGRYRLKLFFNDRFYDELIFIVN